MKEYKVVIKEILKKTVIVEAENKSDALNKAEEQWKAGEYILDADHFEKVEFSA